MKKNTHPPYQEILFVDSSTGATFIIGSTLTPKEKQVHEGKEYPVYKTPVSSASHPFFTGSQQLVDSEGRVKKFARKYQKKQEEQKLQQEKIQKAQEELKSAKKTKKKK